MKPNSKIVEALRANATTLVALADALENNSPQEETDRIVGANDWKEFQFPSRGSFGSFLRGMPESFRAGSKRAAHRADVLKALASRRKAPVIASVDETADELYLRIVK